VVPEERRLIHHPDRAAGPGDGPQLFVVGVAPMRIYARHTGVSHNQRLRSIVNFDRIEKTPAATPPSWNIPGTVPGRGFNSK
jgi:hypothetical protein